MGVKYDYGIWCTVLDELHRGPMLKETAEWWIETWLEDGGKDGVFYIVRRPIVITEWEKV